MADFVLTRTGTQVDDVVEAGNNANATGSDTLLHSGNTGNAVFDGSTPDGTIDEVSLGGSPVPLRIARDTTASATQVQFINPNGAVGTISTTGSTTSYSVSSDPRLKDFKGQPSDDVINSEFDKLFGCFDTFNWKNDLEGQLVWGFNAHLCIDAGLDMGTEGQGPRDLVLGDVYDTVPAELDEDGNEIKPPIDLRVSPAGIDQAKAVPILLAKLEQLERRLKAVEGGS